MEPAQSSKLQTDDSSSSSGSDDDLNTGMQQVALAGQQESLDERPPASSSELDSEKEFQVQQHPSTTTATAPPGNQQTEVNIVGGDYRRSQLIESQTTHQHFNLTKQEFIDQRQIHQHIHVHEQQPAASQYQEQTSGSDIPCVLDCSDWILQGNKLDDAANDILRSTQEISHAKFGKVQPNDANVKLFAECLRKCKTVEIAAFHVDDITDVDDESFHYIEEIVDKGNVKKSISMNGDCVNIVVQEITPEGGVIRIRHCVITFPRGAVSKNTTFILRHIADPKTKVVLDGFTEITPAITCTPAMTFNILIDFSLKALVKVAHEERVTCSVFATSKGQLKCIDEKPILNNCIKFSTQRFEMVCGGVEDKIADKYAAIVISYFLCSDDERNFVSVCCMNDDELIKKLKARWRKDGYKIIFPATDTIKVPFDTELQFQLTCAGNQEGFKFEQNEAKSVKINKDFRERESDTVSFILIVPEGVKFPAEVEFIYKAGDKDHPKLIKIPVKIERDKLSINKKAALLKHIKALFNDDIISKHETLTLDKIDFSGEQLTEEDIDAVAYVVSRCTNLHTLDLHDCCLPKTSVRRLEQELQPGVQIGFLNIKGNEDFDLDDLIAAVDIKKKCNIEELLYDGNLTRKEKQEFDIYLKRSEIVGAKVEEDLEAENDMKIESASSKGKAWLKEEIRHQKKVRSIMQHGALGVNQPVVQSSTDSSSASLNPERAARSVGDNAFSSVYNNENLNSNSPSAQSAVDPTTSLFQLSTSGIHASTASSVSESRRRYVASDSTPEANNDDIKHENSDCENIVGVSQAVVQSSTDSSTASLNSERAALSVGDNASSVHNIKNLNSNSPSAQSAVDPTTSHSQPSTSGIHASTASSVSDNPCSYGESRTRIVAFDSIPESLITEANDDIMKEKIDERILEGNALDNAAANDILPSSQHHAKFGAVQQNDANVKLFDKGHNPGSSLLLQENHPEPSSFDEHPRVDISKDKINQQKLSRSKDLREYRKVDAVIDHSDPGSNIEQRKEERLQKSNRDQTTPSQDIPCSSGESRRRNIASDSMPLPEATDSTPVPPIPEANNDDIKEKNCMVDYSDRILEGNQLVDAANDILRSTQEISHAKFGKVQPTDANVKLFAECLRKCKTVEIAAFHVDDITDVEDESFHYIEEIVEKGNVKKSISMNGDCVNIVEQEITPEGGVIRIRHCVITFPRGAVSENTTFILRHIADPKVKVVLEDFTEITPAITCTPAVKFNVPIHISLTTWVELAHGEHEHCNVFEINEGQLKCTHEKPILDNRIDFSTRRFEMVCGGVEDKIADKYSAFVSYFLCTDDERNFVSVCCMNNDELIEKLKARWIKAGYKLISPATDTIKVPFDTELSFQLTCAGNQGFEFKQNEAKSVKINKHFRERESDTVSFILIVPEGVKFPTEVEFIYKAGDKDHSKLIKLPVEIKREQNGRKYVTNINPVTAENVAQDSSTMNQTEKNSQHYINTSGKSGGGT